MDHKFVYDDVINFLDRYEVNDEIKQILEYRKIKGVYLPVILSKPDFKSNAYKKGVDLIKNDINYILSCSGFKKLRLKYRILFYIIKATRNKKHLFCILYFFVMINNFISSRKIKEFIE